MHSETKSIWSGGAVLALIVYASMAFAQLPGGPPPGAQGPAAGAGGLPGVPGPGGPFPGAGGPPGPDDPNPVARPPLAPDAPQPSPDPRNFDGTWYHETMLVFQITTDMFGYKAPFNDAGRKVMQRRVNSLKTGTPFINASARCIPPGQPWQMDLNTPFHIFQSKDRLDFSFQEYHGLWQVAMDPAKALPPAGKALPPVYMGHSVGHWDGDTLVVETSGFKDGLWLDINGTPASKDAKLTTRMRKVKTNHWFLQVEFTLDDPTYYTRPWSWIRDYSWRPDMTLLREYNCELQTGAKDGVDSSLVPEPQD